MRKGLIEIILGAVLVGFEILSIIGNIVFNNASYRFNSFAELIGFGIGYFFIGICGALILVLGIKKYKKGETVKLILHKETKVLKYIFCVLILLFTVSGIVEYFSSQIDGYDLIVYLLPTISLLLYLCFYQGKKPSVFFAATAIYTACAYILIPLGNVYSIYSLYLTENDALFVKAFVVPLVLQLLCAALNILIGIMIYREDFSVHLLKFLGVASFLLFILSNASTLFDSVIHINFSEVRYLLQSAILIYTCFVPIRVNR